MVYHVVFLFLEEKVFEDLYAEIDKMRPVFLFLLAPQTARKSKDGMASLRQGVATVATPQQRKSPSELDSYTKQLCDWLNTGQKSTIRMMMHWQAGSL